MLNRHCGLRVRNLFDTMISAQMLGYPAVGLRGAGRAPLRREALEGPAAHRLVAPAAARRAARLRSADVSYLVELVADSSSASSTRAEAPVWAQAEFASLEQRVWPEREFDEQGYLRIKGARKLTPRGLAVLRELFLLRDKRARDGDRPPFKVMGNGTLLDLAQNPPTVAPRARQAARHHRPGAATLRPGAGRRRSSAGSSGPEHPPLERKRRRATDAADSTAAAKRGSRSSSAGAPSARASSGSIRASSVPTPRSRRSPARPAAQRRRAARGSAALKSWWAEHFGAELLRVLHDAESRVLVGRDAPARPAQPEAPNDAGRGSRAAGRRASARDEAGAARAGVAAGARTLGPAARACRLPPLESCAPLKM